VRRSGKPGDPACLPPHARAQPHEWAWLPARSALTYTPEQASRLYMVESWFGVLTCPLLHRGDFASGDDVEARITTFAIRHNKKARPYKWSYDAGA
jgi:hypothetical protein